MEETVDTTTNNDVTDTSASESEIQETSSPVTAQADDQQVEESQPEVFVPFKSGKEKFKVNGAEVEWDWDTTKRYAQIGNAGYKAMEKAKALEKKQADTYQQLMDLATRDPEGLIRIFNPQWNGSAKQAQQIQAGQPQDQSEANDPRDHKIRELEQRYQSVAEKLEAQEIAKERSMIESEIQSAVKQFPILGDEMHQEFLKFQYAKALKQGLDVTMEDVAFHVAQKLEATRQAKNQQIKQRIEEKRKKAPVVGTAAPEGTGKKTMSLEDVKRLAGRIV